MGVRDLFPAKPVLGMIHLPALPGAPRSELAMDELVSFALDEAAKLERAGIDGVVVENVGDVPLFKSDVPPVTVAAMARIVAAVREAGSIPVGVNMLRNACEAALAVAHVAGAQFIRCNVVIGAYVTDQGIVEGCSAALARLRRNLAADVLVLGDVHVKHAHPLFDVPIEDAARDLAERGGADAVIVSGRRSPDPPSLERIAAVRGAVDVPVLIGSGVGLENARELYDASDGVLLGEVDFKVGRVWGGASDAAAYAEGVRRCRGDGGDRGDSGDSLLDSHVALFNEGVESGDFSAMLRQFAPDAELVFEGAPVGPFRGLDEITQAYRQQPPDDAIRVARPRRAGDAIVADYFWSREPERRAGEMRLTPRGGQVARLVVTFDSE